MGRLLLVLLVIAVIAVIAVVVARRRAERAQAGARGPSDPLSDPADDDVHHIGVGGIVARDGRDFVVRGTLDLVQDGYRWVEHFLDDVQQKRWLSVEDDEGLQVAMWEGAALADLEQGAPGDREVRLAGRSYRLDERGTATFTATGTTGTAPNGTAEYVDYEAADGALLSFERFGGQAWEVGVGEPVSPSELTIYAAPRD